jgi:hypothetical protein
MIERYKFFLGRLAFIIIQATLFVPVTISIYYVINHWMAFSVFTLTNVIGALIVTICGAVVALFFIASMVAVCNAAIHNREKYGIY